MYFARSEEGQAWSILIEQQEKFKIKNFIEGAMKQGLFAEAFK